MDETDRNSLVEQFSSLTGALENRAQFFLESANWNFELAVQAFFDNADGDSLDVIPSDDPVEEDDEILSGDEMSNNPVPPTAPSKKPAKPSNTGSANIATLSSLQDRAGPEPEHGQAFYAGGSETSGQQILGPDGRKKNTGQFVSDIFKDARNNAEVIDRTAGGPSAGPSSAFTGSGFTLGQSASDSRHVQGPPAPPRRRNDSSDDEEETVLKMWQDGFSVDDGPIRPYTDPQSSQFLAAIRRGDIPPELAKAGRGANLRMEDHHHEKYEPPKTKGKTFGGEGHRLGTPASDVIAQVAASIPSDPASKEKANTDANAFLNFDSSQPGTKIQVRLADGSRMVVQINLSRLVSDLRQYISTARPEYSALPFNLMTTFPNKVIENEKATIQEAGLANSSIVQRLV